MRDAAERIQLGALSYSQNSHAALLSQNQNAKAEASFAHSKRFARFAAAVKITSDVPTYARGLRYVMLPCTTPHTGTRLPRCPHSISPVTANATNLALAFGVLRLAGAFPSLRSLPRFG